MGRIYIAFLSLLVLLNGQFQVTSTTTARFLQQKIDDSHDSVNKYNWTLITTIACKEVHDVSNVLAYKSWRALIPAPDIIFVSTCHPNFADVATTITTFDRTSTGLPLFSDMMAISERVTTDLVAWTNADILLAGDVVTAVSQLHSRLSHAMSDILTPNGIKRDSLWMAVAARRDLVSSTAQRNWSAQIENEIQDNNLHAFLRRHGVLHSQGGADFFVWNQPSVSTIRSPYPPFIRSACSWDNWWIHEAELVRGGVIDATARMTLGHIDHSYLAMNEAAEAEVVEVHKSSSSSRWSQGVYEDWRIYHNNVVARNSAYQRGFYTGLGAVMKLASYLDEEGNLMHRSVKDEPSTYSASLKFPIVSADNTPAPGVPSLAMLLRNIPKSEPVLMTGVTFGYIDSLMNWVCGLRQLDMDRFLLIAAFDKEAFEYLYLQGLPVFYPERKSAAPGNKSAFTHGEAGFRDTTKLKIASVKVVLDTGYDVIWSDSDIIYFRDFREVVKRSPHSLIMQSNNPVPTIKGYTNQKVNSGFYYIKSEPVTIDLVSQVIAHSLISNNTEQKSFDAIFCAKSNLAFCTTAQNHLVVFFDSMKFPNGKVLSFWEHLMDEGKVPEGAYILHNNWIRGIGAKESRVVRSNRWFWDVPRGVCRPKPHCNCIGDE